MQPFDPSLLQRYLPAAQMDRSPVPAAAPVAQGSPEQPEPQQTLPRVPVAQPAAPTAQEGQTHRLAFPQVGQPGSTAAQDRQTQLQAQGSGISRIHNPVLRNVAGVGDAILRTFAPRAEQFTPGTEGNYALHLARAGNAVRGEQEQAKDQSEAQERDARARVANAQADAAQEESRKNVITLGPNQGAFDVKNGTWLVEPTVTAEEKTTEVDPKIGQQLGIQPTKDGRYLVPNQALGALLKPRETKQPTNASELWISQHPEGSAEDLQAFLSKQPKESQLSADDEAILKSVGGDPRVDIRDQPIAVVNKFLAKKKEHIQNPPQTLVFAPNPDQPGGFTSQVVRGAGQTIAPGTLTPGAMGTQNETPTALRAREAQGTIIKTAGDELIANIEKNRGKIGNIGSYWNQFVNGTPISDPDTAGLMAQIGSFAALQPQLHGFRGQQALAEFGKIIGGVPKNPDALISAIKAIQGTAGVVERGGKPAEGGGTLPNVTTQAQFDALPKGAEYMEDGKKFKKP